MADRPVQPDPLQILLAACGLAPSVDEERALAEIHASLAPGIEAMHALSEARYEVPATVFRADPELSSWGKD